MPPPVNFTRERVIQAALDIVEEGGMALISARNIAARMKASTAPVYSHFASIDELRRHTLRQAVQVLLEYIKRPYTGRVFLNIGTGICMFATEHREFYRALFLEHHESRDIVDEFQEKMEKRLEQDQRFRELPLNAKRSMLRKMWIFTHGLATLACADLLDDVSQAYFIRMLDEVGTAVIASEVTSDGTRGTGQ